MASAGEVASSGRAGAATGTASLAVAFGNAADTSTAEAMIAMSVIREFFGTLSPRFVAIHRSLHD
jgi:hypothetical protein